MAAYGLTPRERTVTGLVCHGLSTREIASRLHLAQHTVQDHLKSVFIRTGVRSRRELEATILRREYLPPARAGQATDASGFFAPADARQRAPLGGTPAPPTSSSRPSVTETIPGFRFTQPREARVTPPASSVTNQPVAGWRRHRSADPLSARVRYRGEARR